MFFLFFFRFFKVLNMGLCRVFGSFSDKILLSMVMILKVVKGSVELKCLEMIIMGVMIDLILDVCVKSFSVVFFIIVGNSFEV